MHYNKEKNVLLLRCFKLTEWTSSEFMMLFIALYYRQLSTDIKIKNHKILPLGANKTGFNFKIFVSVFVENCLLYDALHNFSKLLKVGTNLVDINQFKTNT